MDRQARKAATAAYKERKDAYGVFAIVCEATGQAWVGASRHLDTQQNSLWFGLRHSGGPYKSLREAWALHGEGEFRFEELERLRDDFPAITRSGELKQRQAIWVARLQATSL
jgi:hypothetical protein